MRDVLKAYQRPAYVKGEEMSAGRDISSTAAASASYLRRTRRYRRHIEPPITSAPLPSRCSAPCPSSVVAWRRMARRSAIWPTCCRRGDQVRRCGFGIAVARGSKAIARRIEPLTIRAAPLSSRRSAHRATPRGGRAHDGAQLGYKCVYRCDSQPASLPQASAAATASVSRLR
jgi:hypothetical protein